MLQKFKKFISDNNLLNPGDRVLLAVSGGIDSMVMTHLFMESEHEIGIAHCNFSLRASESDLDEEMVSNFAGEHNIVFFTTRFETKAYARENGLSVQMAARELRYAWFERLRKEHGYDAIAIAHNLNDNIETLLINLIRGTGVAGLTGMKPSGSYIIRPLLFATRQDIIYYCNRNRIIYREDLSNAETKYLRNKIRHLILPLLREINPSVELTLNETAERFTGINEIVTIYIKELREKVSVQRTNYITFNISSLKVYLHNKVVLFELFKPYGISDVSLDDLINIIEGKTGGLLITGSHRIVKNRKEILILSSKDESDGIRLIINFQNFEKIPEIESFRSLRLTEEFKIPASSLFSCMDMDKLSFPLVLRKWNTGDHFYPLGMNHRKKLSDHFIDNKYSLLDKENALIIESDGKIACILGDRIDNRFRITDSSKNALILEVRKTGPS